MMYTFEPIGVVRSCFTEKFGAPRQAGLIPEAAGEVELFPPYGNREAVRAIESFSHIWIVFVFHRNTDRAWTPTVRPPRCGGNRRIGVFASRSGFRPNPIGLSAVRLEGIEQEGDRCRLRIAGADLVDGTPVLDVKPYLPYADRIDIADGGIAADPPPRRLRVEFSAEAQRAVRQIETDRGSGLLELIEAMLALDPRPAYRRDDDERLYGCKLWGYDIRWQIHRETARVLSIGYGSEFDLTIEKR